MSNCPKCNNELVELVSLSEERKNDWGTLNGFTYSHLYCKKCKLFYDSTFCWSCEYEELVEIKENEHPDIIADLKEKLMELEFE